MLVNQSQRKDMVVSTPPAVRVVSVFLPFSIYILAVFKEGFQTSKSLLI